MNQPPRNIKDGETASGSVNSVKRIGATVIRPVGPWSISVHSLLNYLECKGFPYSPRAIALDQKREVLSYIDGSVAMRPWPDCLLTEDGISAVSKMLLQYHQIVRGYVPKSDSVWRVPGVRWKKGMIVRHGDLGPWNMVWHSDQLVGLIDWDFAEPGYPIEDVAQIAWDCVPLYPPPKSTQAGVLAHEQTTRLEVLCASYGADISTVINTVDKMQKREFLRLKSIGSTGQEPWRGWMQQGGLQEITDASQWLHDVYQPNTSQPIQLTATNGQ